MKEKNIYAALMVVLAALILVFVSSNQLFAEEGKIAIGVQGGLVTSIANEAIDGYSDTEWDNGFAFGINTTYRFPVGLTLGIDLQRFETELTENDFEIGEATITPLLFMIGMQSIPTEKRGLAGHLYVGLGYSFNDCDEGDDIEQLARDIEELLDYYGYDADVSLKLDIEDSFAFALGLGGDYFFNENFSWNIIDIRMLLLSPDGKVKVKVEYAGESAEDELTEELNLNNIQISTGLKFWF